MVYSSPSLGELLLQKEAELKYPEHLSHALCFLCLVGRFCWFVTLVGCADGHCAFVLPHWARAVVVEVPQSRYRCLRGTLLPLPRGTGPALGCCGGQGTLLGFPGSGPASTGSWMLQVRGCKPRRGGQRAGAGCLRGISFPKQCFSCDR